MSKDLQSTGVDPSAPRDRQSLLMELKVELRAYQSALDAFDEAVSVRLGINRTDLRCLDLLEQRQPLTAGALAEASGVTTGAMTFLLDRLEKAGFVVRRRDELDRRRVLVELVAEAGKRAWALHEPMVMEARAAAASFSAEELGAICRFLGNLRTIYERHSAILRGEPGKG